MGVVTKLKVALGRSFRTLPPKNRAGQIASDKILEKLILHAIVKNILIKLS
jgi:hypothetical protein